MLKITPSFSVREKFFQIPKRTENISVMALKMTEIITKIIYISKLERNMIKLAQCFVL